LRWRAPLLFFLVPMPGVADCARFDHDAPRESAAHTSKGTVPHDFLRRD